MNAAMQVSVAAMLASTGRSVLQTPQDANRVEDLHELWKAVFEGARPVEASPDGACPPATDACALPERPDAGRDARDSLPGRGANRSGVAHPPAAFPIDASNALTGMGVYSSSVATTPMADQRGASAGAIVAAATRNGRQAHKPDVVSSSKIASTITITTAAMPSASAESVNVFVQGVAVAIVVRDAGVSAEEALHCAFETARELTGHRGALQRLTLNGRTVYQQQNDSSACGLTSFSELTFAC